jgi:hypothetical protein
VLDDCPKESAPGSERASAEQALEIDGHPAERHHVERRAKIGFIDKRVFTLPYEQLV